MANCRCGMNVGACPEHNAHYNSGIKCRTWEPTWADRQLQYAYDRGVFDGVVVFAGLMGMAEAIRNRVDPATCCHHWVRDDGWCKKCGMADPENGWWAKEYGPK